MAESNRQQMALAVRGGSTEPDSEELLSLFKQILDISQGQTTKSRSQALVGHPVNPVDHVLTSNLVLHTPEENQY
jgi:hypothetical protein